MTFKTISDTINLWITTNWEWTIIFFILFVLILRVLVRGFFWKTRSGEKLTFKQFMKRWKVGLEGVTYMQQLKMQIWGIWVNILGLVLGIIVMSISRPQNLWWWLLIILSAGLFLVIVGLIGVLQKYWIQKRIDQTIKELNKEVIYDEASNINKEQYSKIKPIVSPYLKYK